MIFNKKTIRDIEIDNRIVLLRVDYNVPLKDGQVTDDYRIRQSVATVQQLRQRNCRIIIISHLGRPDGKAEPTLSLEPVAQRLGELLGIEVSFVPATIGDQVAVAAKALQPGGVLLLENLRFHAEEENNDREFARQLADPAEYFVQDGFGVVHRAHASTSAVTEFLPSVAGPLLENEVRQLSVAIENPVRPLIAIMGGAKISDKIELINRFLTQANTIIIGGAMANTFLAASGHEIGKSVYAKDEVKEAEEIIKLADRAHVELILPLTDVAIAEEVSESAQRREVATDQVGPTDMILDFGEQSTQAVLNKIERAGTVIWNGPLGVIELEQFAASSKRLAEFIVQKQVNCVVGGGDTAGFVHQLGLTEKFTHVSTGGGASLELLSGKELPGIAALLDK